MCLPGVAVDVCSLVHGQPSFIYVNGSSDAIALADDVSWEVVQVGPA
jgi:hypothetical protein